MATQRAKEEPFDLGNSDDEDTSSTAIRSFLLPKKRTCPFVPMENEFFATHRSLALHCRMKHKDKSGNPMLVTPVE